MRDGELGEAGGWGYSLEGEGGIAMGRGGEWGGMAYKGLKVVIIAGGGRDQLHSSFLSGPFPPLSPSHLASPLLPIL